VIEPIKRRQVRGIVDSSGNEVSRYIEGDSDVLDRLVDGVNGIIAHLNHDPNRPEPNGVVYKCPYCNTERPW